ncbi:MAG: oxidoreductase [Proteobacteria bacterium]|nr:MAG: oxidoreductase [Pseudomonadota bacterium]
MSAQPTDLYRPQVARIAEVRELTTREKYFRLELEQPLKHKPGQFVMVSLFGIGECAISITCGPHARPEVELVIRRAGNVTGVIHGYNVGDVVGIRGPFGNGFDLDRFARRELVVVAGGLGLVPLRSLLQPVVADRLRFGSLTLVTGARTPAETLFRDELTAWSKIDGVTVIETVDRTEHQPWNGRVGLVTGPIGELTLDPANTRVVLCGPPVMYKFVLLELAQHHAIPAQHIYVDLERRMRCGVGKCGHCQINELYCCQDGPVFRYADLANYPEALS